MRLLLCLLLLVTVTSVNAIETVSGTNTSYKTNNNISSSVSGWSSGWGSGTNTGWNYVGQVSDASGVYLGNGWVITAAHVNSPNTFTLNGNVYDATGISYTNFTNSATGATNADIHLFQISTTSTTGTNLTLSSLTLTSTAPSGTVVTIGYGYTNGVGPESWGVDPIAYNTISPVSVNSFESVDFLTLKSGGSYSTLVLGDSGGGDFIKVGNTWELAGLNEAVNASYSYYVQLSAYDAQIQADMLSAVPEPSTWAFMGLGAVTLLGASFWRGRNRKS